MKKKIPQLEKAADLVAQIWVALSGCVNDDEGLIDSRKWLAKRWRRLPQSTRTRISRLAKSRGLAKPLIHYVAGQFVAHDPVAQVRFAEALKPFVVANRHRLLQRSGKGVACRSFAVLIRWRIEIERLRRFDAELVEAGGMQYGGWRMRQEFARQWTCAAEEIDQILGSVLCPATKPGKRSSESAAGRPSTARFGVGATVRPKWKGAGENLYD